MPSSLCFLEARIQHGSKDAHEESLFTLCWHVVYVKDLNERVGQCI